MKRTQKLVTWGIVILVVLVVLLMLMLVVVDGQFPHGVGAPLGNLAVAGGSAGMADGSPHPGQQFIRAEGLGEIVVSPQIQSGNLILLMGTGGNHHHRQGSPAAELAQNIQTVHIRQTQIQNHQIRAVGGDHGHGLRAAAHPHGFIAVGGQHGGNKMGNALFVFNDQNFFANIHRVSSLTRGRQKINSAPSL